MKTYTKQLMFVLPFLVIGSMVEALAGILSNDGSGPFFHKSIRGQLVEIYGKGVYRHMSSDVAVQGIAQDYITLFVAIPVLIVAFYFSRRGSIKAKLVLSGTLLYFVLTYLFYIGIALYNEVFLVAAMALFCSLFAFILNIMGFDFAQTKASFRNKNSMRLPGFFLIVMAVMMTLLWLSVIVPPLLDGSFYPKTLYHYSTLIVQGYDFGIFLPLAFVSGVLGLQRNEYAYVLIPTYLVFLSILMIALIAKIIFMAQVGAGIFPVIIIIPIILFIALFFTIKTLRDLQKT